MTERCSEKYWKKLIGRTDLEDALKRLNNLTNGQVQVPTAEVQRATQDVDETVGGVTEHLVRVDDKAASNDDQVAEVIDGAQIIISES